MDELRRQNYLRMMGVTQWRLRQSDSPEAIQQAVAEAEADVSLVERPAPAGDLIEPTVPVTTAVDQSDWLTLREQVKTCRQCGLRAGCSQTVFGVGNQQADMLVIGEAPGADEDRQGEPFVGRAGQLLNAMLLAMGFKREAVFIANIVKCRPPDNRDPAAEEALACQDYLLRQIVLIQPKLILSVGRISAQNLLQTDIAVGKLRGRVHAFGETNIPLVVTYHPAYLLRSPEQKSKAWQDLQLALSVLGPVSRDQGQA
ncbi:MAG: uracil-DNA glycosylase [Candidatus Thiodiazotropha sp. 'RUGA']|nr:uracil-DNA glycosylase [Candidatus Thiodiazotropha sp. 'RUGA']